MKKIALSALTAVAASQLLVPLVRSSAGPAFPPSLSDTSGQHPLVIPSGPGPMLPPSSSEPDPPVSSGPGSGSIMLSDVMGRDRSINIFAGLVRDIESAARRLDDSAANSTVLAPLNSAVDKLPRKPWEDPGDYESLGANAYEGDDGQDRAQRNLQRFVEAHIIPMSPWPAGEKVKAVGNGQDVWWEEKDGVKVVGKFRPSQHSSLNTEQIQPGSIEVVSIGRPVANGEVVRPL